MNLIRKMDLPHAGWIRKRLDLNMKYILLLLIFNFVSINAEIDPDKCPKGLNWKPSLYSISISTNIKHNSTSFNGKVLINGVITQDTDQLYIHGRVNLTKAFYTIDGIKTEIDLTNTIINNKTQVIIFILDETLLKGVEFKLTIIYNANYSSNHGLYQSEYTGPNKQKRPVLSTDFQPTGARLVFPCIDLPRFKAIFELKISRPQSMVVVSNTELKSTSSPDPEIDNQVWDIFYPTPKMSTYLVAFVIADGYLNYTIIEGQTIWFPPGYNKSIEAMAKIVPKVLKTLEEYTQIEYKLDKLDHIIIPEKKPIAMENWGLITYRANFMLNREFGADPRREMSFVIYIIHELIHQWFGNLVTCKYWCYMWLNEGLTTYISNLVISEVYPKSKGMEFFITHNLFDAMVSESIAPVRLVDNERCCEEEASPWKSVFSAYNKAAAILHMIHKNFMTEATFKQGLMQYLQDNQYDTVTEKKLWNAFKPKLDQSVVNKFPENQTFETLIESWTRSLGYPILNVYRNETNGSIAIQQEMFYVFERFRNNKEKWWIPLTYTTSKEKDFNNLTIKEYIKPNTQIQFISVILEPNEWIILNLQNTAFYQVNYDLKMWNVIIDHLINKNIDDIHPMNRAQLINDIFAFASVAKLSYSTALNLTKYLSKEYSYAPFAAGLTSIGSVINMSRKQLVNEKIKAFFRHILNNVYKYVMSKDFIPNDLEGKMFNLKAITFGCKLDYNHCKNMVLQTVHSIMNQTLKEEEILPELREVFWCSAAKFGNLDIFNYMKQRIINDNDINIKDMFFIAIHCIRDKDILLRFMNDMSFNADYLKGENRIDMIRNLINIDTICNMIDFYINKFDEIMIEQGKQSLIEQIAQFYGTFVPEECHYQLIKLIDEKVPELKHRRIVSWNKNFAEHIEQWINTQTIPQEIQEIKDPINPNKFLYPKSLDIYDDAPI